MDAPPTFRTLVAERKMDLGDIPELPFLRKFHKNGRFAIPSARITAPVMIGRDNLYRRFLALHTITEEKKSAAHTSIIICASELDPDTPRFIDSSIPGVPNCITPSNLPMIRGLLRGDSVEFTPGAITAIAGCRR